MPLPVVPKGYRTITRFSNVERGNPWSIVQDFRTTGVGSDGAADEVADALLEAWQEIFAQVGTGAALETFIFEAVRIDQITVYALFNDDAPVINSVASGLGVEGTNSTQPAPPDLAVVVTKRTQTRGRRARGRAYMAGWAASAIAITGGVAGTASSALLAGFTDHMLTIGGSPFTSSYEAGVISQFSAGNPTEFFPITNYTVDANWDVQRRRGVG